MRIIWLKTGPLHPLDTGGKIRTYNMLRVLKRSHEITYVALCTPETDDWVKNAASEYCQRAVWIPWREARKRSANFYLELAANVLGSTLPFVIQKYRSAAMTSAIQSLDRSGLHDLIVCDFLTPAVNLFFAGVDPKTPLLLFQHNVESLIWKRMFKQAGHAAKRFYLRGQWRRLEKFERETCVQCDGVVGVSAEDCEIMRGEFGLSNVLGDVPTGVDCQTYAPGNVTRQPRSLVFLGSMDWMPNIDAVEFFTNEIWAGVKGRYPDARLTVVGRNPPAKLKDLEKRFPGIRVTGTVEDVKPFLHEAAAMIVPLRVGGGTRIKIFEGMATGIPVVSTRIGAEGLPVTHGENILLADTPADFAAQIGVLFENPDQAKRIGATGRILVRDKFSWETVTGVFEDYCDRVCNASHSGVEQKVWKEQAGSVN
jgi:glycosyltransferase involved in cell wall biosynthesis